MLRRRSQAGLAYLALLFIVVALGASLALTGTLWSAAQQREKERDLLFVGNQFRQAIGEYYERTPGYIKRYPVEFKDLLRDDRQVGMVRYLRKIYSDPITASLDWGIVHAPDGGIMGVYSKAPGRPIKQQNFLFRDGGFEAAENYAQWRFIYVSPTATRP